MRSIKKFAAIPAALILAASMTACQDNSVETEPAPGGGNTAAPTQQPTQAPTEEPTQAPTEQPTQAPTEEPTQAPTEQPGGGTTEEPGGSGTEQPGGSGGNTVSEGEAAFGDTWAFDDGLSITVSKPDDTWEPSNGRSEGWDEFVAFDVTITNNTGEKYDPSFMLFDIQSGGREGTEIFDSGNPDKPTTGGASGSLLDGKSITYTVAFGVEDPKDLVLELTPDLDRDEKPTWVL